ncbi:hypothetical protein CISG_05135 [Coccidioides immitis RMSCC 3703]|uniref:Uncharacterized protein n=1 Tax=Coccidioides immitis RMSCC 3703 TaxID=454286 RepID=A0A0J8TP35_COCIT|nr:hypothetical protein CISG_05135 [Coccidioides immitis RMSCC 3703]
MVFSPSRTVIYAKRYRLGTHIFDVSRVVIWPYSISLPRPQLTLTARWAGILAQSSGLPTVAEKFFEIGGLEREWPASAIEEFELKISGGRIKPRWFSCGESNSTSGEYNGHISLHRAEKQSHMELGIRRLMGTNCISDTSLHCSRHSSSALDSIYITGIDPYVVLNRNLHAGAPRHIAVLLAVANELECAYPASGISGLPRRETAPDSIGPEDAQFCRGKWEVTQASESSRLSYIVVSSRGVTSEILPASCKAIRWSDINQFCFSNPSPGQGETTLVIMQGW